MQRPYILWLGGVFDDSTVENNIAVSPAANLWQKGLIRALQQQEIGIINITHLPEPLWPKGRSRLTNKDGILDKDIKGEMVGYYNLPFWRNQSLRKAYLNALNSLIQREGNPKLLMTYNLSYQNIAVGKYAQEKLGVPWVSIIADEVKKYKILKLAKGRIFLSWFAYKNCPYAPKFHLDGGEDKLHFTNNVNMQHRKDDKLVVLYTGSMARWAGVSFLVKGFQLVKNQNVELRIHGKGINKDVQRAVISDPRVKFMGFVSRERLEEIYEMANIFVNPRLFYLPENRYNFPSKLPKYLSYCKPVISTWTDGLSPDYRDLLIIPEQETPECLARTIENVLEWDESRYNDLSSRIKMFMEANKMWSIQAERLIKWLESEIFFDGRKDK